jgi:replicative DNA helicase
VSEHEDALLYHCLWGKADEVLSLVTVDDFTPGERQELARIVERGHAEGILQAAWVMDEATRLGRPSRSFVASISTAGFTGTVSYYAARVREASARRYAEAVFTRALHRLKTEDPDTVAQEAKAEIEAMPTPASSDDDTWTLEDLMRLDVEHEPFAIPGWLRRGERLVLTGGEGSGKSVLVYQILTGAAFGVDTFTMERVKPQRVLFLDVENSEFQARGNLDKIVPALKELAPDAEPEWRSFRRRVIDLIATRDKADLIRRVAHYAPDVMYLGTAYKLTEVTDETHRSVRAIQSTVDRIRQEVGCAVIVEHHAGHGFQNDRNSMRPEGSSFWLRWPDFGYGLSSMPMPNGRRVLRMKAWRGDRASDRCYPAGMRQGDLMPWVPIPADEWEVLYEQDTGGKR